MGTRTLDQQAETGPGSPQADGWLLEQFINRHDETAFAELVARHGPYIMGVCRRVTAHVQDAEDVFQACFLELARKPASIQQRNSVAGWLQTVAVRLGRRACVRRGQQRRREVAEAMPEAIADAADVSWREVRQVLEEEIARLPDELRGAVVVCLFEGRTQEEAARILNINPRTLKDRVRRGRELLRGRLTRRGISLAVMGALLSGGTVEASVPEALETATLQGALAAANKTALAGTVSSSALTLTAGAAWLTAGWGAIAAFAVALAVSSTAAYVAWQRASARPMQSVRASFRGGHFNHALFQWSGPMPEKFIRLQDKGLRITLPSQDGPAQPVGIALRPTVRGDFELDATFEFLDVATPVDQWAAGLTVYFFMDDEEWNGLWFGKMNDRERGPVLVTGHRIGNRNHGEQRIPKFASAVAAGGQPGVLRLRAVRRGSQFSLFASDSETGEFEPLQTLEVSGADVRIVRFAADPGWSRNLVVDGRLVEVTIRAEELVGYTPRGKRTETNP